MKKPRTEAILRLLGASFAWGLRYGKPMVLLVGK
jgi:hypothetical protein